MKYPIAILAGHLILLATTNAHPGHPGHEDWPFDAISWSKPLIALSVFILGWMAVRLLRSSGNRPF